MAYNLPSAWDAGYALPENVEDEGLERRAFVTKQMPRGTYDNPSVGTGGMAVPQYVRDEGYGQGTFTTKWQPSGSYSGPRVPNWLNQRPKVLREQRIPGGGRVVTVQSLGDDDAPMPLPFAQYGQKAAQALLTRVAQLPPGSREAALRTIMNQVDKSLWSRTQTITKRYMAQGVPLAQAFPEALARALSTGIAAELIDTGMRRSAPQAKSLLGLGCYGPQALGAIRVDDTGGGKTTRKTDTPPKPPPIYLPPATPGAPPIVVVQPPPPILATTPSAPPPPLPPPVDLIKVGGFLFAPGALGRVWGIGTPSPAGTKGGTANRAAPPDAQFDDPAKISPETIAFLRDQLLAPTGDATRSFCSTDAATGFPEWDASTWFGALGLDCNSKLNLHPLWHLRTALSPLARVKNTITGEDMVMHVSLARRDLSQPADPTSNPLILKAWLSRIPDPGMWQSIWNTLTWLPMTLANAAGQVVAPVITPIVKGGIAVVDATKDAIGDGLKKLGDLACDLMKTPGVGAAAGAVGATVAGVPPQAGAAAGATGAAIAQGACGAPPPPPVPLPVVSSSILPLAILGGVAVVGAFLLFGDKKRSPPPMSKP